MGAKLAKLGGNYFQAQIEDTIFMVQLAQISPFYAYFNLWIQYIIGRLGFADFLQGVSID